MCWANIHTSRECGFVPVVSSSCLKISIYKCSFTLQTARESVDLLTGFNKSGLALWNDVEIVAQTSCTGIKKQTSALWACVCFSVLMFLHRFLWPCSFFEPRFRVSLRNVIKVFSILLTQKHIPYGSLLCVAVLVRLLFAFILDRVILCKQISYSRGSARICSHIHSLPKGTVALWIICEELPKGTVETCRGARPEPPCSFRKKRQLQW